MLLLLLLLLLLLPAFEPLLAFPCMCNLSSSSFNY